MTTDPKPYGDPERRAALYRAAMTDEPIRLHFVGGEPCDGSDTCAVDHHRTGGLVRNARGYWAMPGSPARLESFAMQRETCSVCSTRPCECYS